MCQIESGTNIHDLQRRFLLPDERFRSKIEKKNQLISFPRTDTEANRRSCAWQMQGCCSPGDGSEHKVIVGERELWAVAMRGLEGEKVT
jgi:hypothetical protein